MPRIVYLVQILSDVLQAAIFFFLQNEHEYE